MKSATASKETKVRSKISVKAAKSSPASTKSIGRDLAESPPDYSSFHIFLLVESDTNLSPYVHHINDQSDEERYHVLNDQRIMASRTKTETKGFSRSEASKLASSRVRESSELFVPNLSVEKAHKLTYAIKTELARIQKGRGHATDSTMAAMSDLVNMGMASAGFRTEKHETRELFVLISTIFNPHLPKLLLESGIPVQAIIRLVDNEEFSQQTGYYSFYENFVKKYRFKKQLKRAAKNSGDGRDFTKQLGEDIRTFWTTLASLRKQNPKTFRNTIFIDHVLPFVELKPDATTFRAMIEVYRTQLHEDTRTVLDSVRNIGRAHQCYEKGKDVQNMRALHTWDSDELTEYKISILTSGFSVPCIVESILQQVVYTIKEKKISDQLTRDFPDSSEVQLEPGKTLEENKKVYELATFLFAMTDRLDNYFVLDKYCSISTALHARDEAKLAFLMKQITRQTINTNLRLFRTFVEGLTRDHFSNVNHIVEGAKAFMSKKLVDGPMMTNGCKFDSLARRHNVAKALVNKKFYLSYYLSMFGLGALKSACETKYLERSDIVDDLGYLIRENLSLALNGDEQSDVYSEGMFDRLLNIQEFESEMRGIENETSEQGLEPILDLNEKVEYFKEKFSKGFNQESLCNVFNYVENIAPNSMLQIIFHYVTNADRVSLTRLPITDDVLIHCRNNLQCATNWTFVIPTILGFHDFYHHLVENTPNDDAIGDLLTCPEPETPSDRSTNYCQSETFVLPDSIKYERLLNPVHSTEGSKEEVEVDSTTGEDKEGNMDTKPALKQLYYKYGGPQIIENSGSLVTHRFDESVTLKIEKNYWTHKNIENVTVACRIRAHNSDLTQRDDHFLYYHTKIDLIQHRLMSLDFHIHLNANIRIGFKKKTRYVQHELYTENSTILDSAHVFPDQRFLYPPHVSPAVNTVYDQGVVLFHKFASTEFDYYPVITSDTGLNINVSTASTLYIQQFYSERDIFPSSVRKYLINASVVVVDPTRGEVLTMMATGKTIVSYKSSSMNLDGKSGEIFRTITADGDVYETQDGIKNLKESSKLKMTRRENLAKNSLELTRDDGLSMHFCSDGTLHVVHLDGTRFTTVVKETVTMTTEFNSGEVTMETESITGEFVLVDIFVEIFHEKYFPIVYNFREETIMICGPNGFELSLRSDGTQKFRVDEISFFTVGPEQIHWAVDKESDDGDFFQFEWSAESPDSTIVTLTNDRETIKVDCSGNLRTCLSWTENYDEQMSACQLSWNQLTNNDRFFKSANSLNKYEMNTASENSLGAVYNSSMQGVNDPFSNSTFIVVSSDFSGFEILPTSLVSSLKEIHKRQNTPSETFVVQELDTTDPYYCKLLLQALPRGSRNGHHLISGTSFKARVENSSRLTFQNADVSSAGMGTEVGDLLCSKQTRLPSTYGADWSFPFCLKQNRPCPPLNHNILYRLLHRVNRTGDEILELFSQALEDSRNFDKDVTGIARKDSFSDHTGYFASERMDECHRTLSDEEIGQRFCLGNMPLISVSRDDIETIRAFVNEMIRRAVLLGTISWAGEEKRRLMGILSKRAEFFTRRHERLSKASEVEERDKKKSCSIQKFYC